MVALARQRYRLGLDFAAFLDVLGISKASIFACGNQPGSALHGNDSVDNNMMQAASESGVQICYSPEAVNFDVYYSSSGRPEFMWNIYGERSQTPFPNMLRCARP